MPELPEVETIVRGLSSKLPGRTVASVDVLLPSVIAGSSPEEFSKRVSGSTVGSVGRRAKNILIDLGERLLVINLGMTGRLLLTGESEDVDRHTAVRFLLDGGGVLTYHDVRRFGRLEVMPPAEWQRRSEMMGLEPLSDEFTPEALYQLTRTSRMAIKPWLMDQKRVVGVGNIYASEALWRARISPRRGARRLTRAKAARLHSAIQQVLLDAIQHRGTTLSDYRDSSGERGDFVQRLAVYDRAGADCPRCGSEIRRLVQAGRSTFFCPHCQTD